MPTEQPGRALARAVVAAQKAALSQPKPPATARHVVTLPLSVVDTALSLRDATQALYLHLWVQSRRHAPNPDRRWMWYTDSRLLPELGIAQRTLTRARADLVQRDLLRITTNQGHRDRPTYYLLTWPLPLPHTCPPIHAHIYLDELAAYGHPPTPRAAWMMLVLQRGPDRVRELAHAWAHRPGSRALAALRRADPWIADQLAWGDPAAYRACSAQQTRIEWPE